jgi:hypothetical protein
MSEILGELAEEVAVDLRSGLGCVDGKVCCLSDREGRWQKCSDEPQTEQNSTHHAFLLETRVMTDSMAEGKSGTLQPGIQSPVGSPYLALLTIEVRHWMRQVK